MNIGIAQINPTIGDIVGNREKIEEKISQANNNNADLLITPEMSLTGYPPMDILRRDKLYEVQERELNKLKNITDSTSLTVLVGYCRRDETGLHNSAAVLSNGKIIDTYDKILLPNYDVFDDERYFENGDSVTTITVNGDTVGLTICEDGWYNTVIMNSQRHEYNPYEQFPSDIDYVINMSASPFSTGKRSERHRIFNTHSQTLGVPVVFCNQVGANDEIVFDGNSFISDGGNMFFLDGYREDFEVIDMNNTTFDHQYTESKTEEMINAIKLGISDYFAKTGNDTAIVGMSGGVDSSVATVLTSQSRNVERVIGVSMPSKVTSDESITDARKVAKSLGIDFRVIDIQPMVEKYEQGITDNISGVAYENIQARVRGDILMTLSNITNGLVITPDNKSEGAIGYCTLYGDTVGAIAPLGDCYKEYVYDIAEYYHSNDGVIPNNVIEKEPTAELKEGQTDEDDMPPYTELDNVLYEYMEGRKKPSEINSNSDVGSIVKRLHNAEFKRRQSPPPIRVTGKDVSRGWRYPIAADYDFLTE